MFFGLTFEKLLVIGVLAAFIIGPERLPAAAEKFAKFVRSAGQYMRGAKQRMRDEIGPEIDDVDWRKLDPRQYDPRRIIRDALFEDTAPRPTPPSGSAAAGGAAAGVAAVAGASGISDGLRMPGAAKTATAAPVFSAEEPPPYDTEAT